MSYIGNTPAENYASFLTETFSVSATANYTLTHAVSNENDIRLVINSVVQQPGSGKAYTASGTTLTLTSATSSGDVMYAVYLGRALQTVTPPNASVGTSQLIDGNVTLAKLGADSVNATKIADGSIENEHLNVLAVTGQTAETSIADGDTILIHDASASALRKMTKANFVSGIGGSNTPAVFAKLSSSQTIPGTTTTTVAFAQELVDTNNAFNTSTYTFTVPSGEAGLYSVSVFLRKSNWNAARWYIDLLTSGGNFVFEQGTDASGNYNTAGGTIITNLSVGNTVYVRTYQGNGSGEVITNDGSYLAIHKLIQ